MADFHSYVNTKISRRLISVAKYLFRVPNSQSSCTTGL